MSFFQCMGFKYNNIHSSTYGLYLTTSGDSNIPFAVGGYEILEESILRVDKPLFLGVNKKPLEFNMEIHKLSAEPLTETELRNISKWLFQKTYKPLISDTYPTIQYNVIFVNYEKIIVGNVPRGISVTARCDSPYPYLLEQTKTATVGAIPSDILVENSVSNYIDKYNGLEFQFTLTGTNTTVSIQNITTSKTMSLTGLTVGETIYINTKRKEIISSLGGNRFPNFNYVWLYLEPLIDNTFRVTGECAFSMKYSLPILQ